MQRFSDFDTCSIKITPPNRLMLQQSLHINGIRLAWYEQNPDKTRVIVFVHGNSSSSLTWRKQFSDPALKDYRLVAVDLPGHGESDPIADPAKGSNLKALAAVLIEALTALNLTTDIVLAGVSLGTNVVSEMVSAGFRPTGLFLAGPCIIGEGYGLEKVTLPGADPTVVFSDDASDEVVRKYAKETSISEAPEDLEIFLKDYYRTQPFFRSFFFESLTAGVYADEVGALRQTGLPIGIVFGADEKVVNPDYLDNAFDNLWGYQIFKIQGASHLVNVDQSVAFSQLLAAYARQQLLI